VTDPARAAAAYLRTERADLVQTVGECADRVAGTWPGDAATDSGAVRAPLREELDAAGALDRFPEALSGAAEAAGRELLAEPVAAPPYVVVTSRGPLLRAGFDTERLLLGVAVFTVDRAPRRYRRRETRAWARLRPSPTSER
jgi:hypothetical protein